MSKSDPPAELRVEEWIRRARDDELVAEILLREHEGSGNVVCFHAHQMAEKYLKAFLVARRNWFPKIHPLDALTELCSEIDPSFAELKEGVTFLEPFYRPTRYPGDYPDFTWDDARKAFEVARLIKAFVVERLPSTSASE